MWKYVRKWLRNRRLQRDLVPRIEQIQRELQQTFHPRLDLIFIPPKGGFDVTFRAMVDARPFGILRINTPRPKVPPRRAFGVKRALPPADRIQREWTCYQQLYPLGLTPEPLWKADDAALCAHVPWPRASRVLKGLRDDFWPVFERIVSAVRTMHSAGIAHLDLNSGNIFLEPNGTGVILVDFELGAAENASMVEQRAYDWLRLLLCISRRRRGGNYLHQQPERFAQLFAEPIADILLAANQSFLAENFPDLAEAEVEFWWSWLIRNQQSPQRLSA